MNNNTKLNKRSSKRILDNKLKVNENIDKKKRLNYHSNNKEITIKVVCLFNKEARLGHNACKLLVVTSFHPLKN